MGLTVILWGFGGFVATLLNGISEYILMIYGAFMGVYGGVKILSK